MLTDTTHYAPRDIAEAHLAAMDWTEIALNTWVNPEGDYEASFADYAGSVVEVRVRRVN